MDVKHRLLIVDDDSNLRKTLSDIFRVKGYAPIAVATGQVALDRVEEERPAVALVDLRLEDMSGLEVVREIKKCSPGTECILLTGYASQESAIEAVNLGAYSYVQKPYDIEQLLVTIRRAIEKREAVEALRRRNRELVLLNRASHALAATLDLDHVLVAILEQARRLLDVVVFSVWLIDPETDELVCQQATGLKGEIVRGWRLSPGKGVAGWVARSGESLIVPDTRADVRYFKDVDRRTGLETRSILSVPLRVKQGVIGVLQAVDAEADRFEATDLTLLELLATSAGIAIDNARLVEALRRHTVELQGRNNELDAFAHTVAHDLKSPLGLVVGLAEVLGEDYTTMPDEELGRYLHTVARNARKMSSIVDALLLLAEARKMQVKTGPLDMASIVAEARQRLIPLVEQYQAEIILPDAWPVALGYGPWVEEVWVNYLSNAIKYGGRPPRVELGAMVQADGMVCFWVRDNGLGLTPEEQARLFTPFTQLDQIDAKGHGLGLSIVLRIIERLGGQVGMKSEVGRNSTFWFVLPA